MGLMWCCWGNNCEHVGLQRGLVLTCFCTNHPAEITQKVPSSLKDHSQLFAFHTRKGFDELEVKEVTKLVSPAQRKRRPSISVNQAFRWGRVDFHQRPGKGEGVWLFQYLRFHFGNLSEARRSSAGVGQSHPGGLQGNFCRWIKCAKIFSAYSLGCIASGWGTKRC